MNLFHKIRERFYRNRRKLPADSSRAERGRYGEDIAADFCKCDLGYQQIARNWRYKRDEIDLVCRDGEVLVFIEVRSRSADALVSGFHSVDAKKKANLLRAFKAYIKQLPNPPKHFRFDVIDVVLHSNGSGEPRHYPNVSLFNKHYAAHDRYS